MSYSSSVQFNAAIAHPGYWQRADALQRERDAARKRKLFLSVADVVLSLVDADRFDVLPPSPRAIVGKARLLDLLTQQERWSLDF